MKMYCPRYVHLILTLISNVMFKLHVGNVTHNSTHKSIVEKLKIIAGRQKASALNTTSYLSKKNQRYIELTGGIRMTEAQREKALSDYRSKLMEHREVDAKLKKMRADCKALTKQYDKSENDLKALQSVGQIVGEVLR